MCVIDSKQVLKGWEKEMFDQLILPVWSDEHYVCFPDIQAKISSQTCRQVNLLP